MVLVHKVVNLVERLELVVRIVILAEVTDQAVPDGNLAVVLILEVLFFPVSFRVLLEDGVPPVYLVECLVEQVLLPLAVLAVLFRDFFLVSHLYAQNAGKQVGSVVDPGCCCRLHVSWILCVENSVIGSDKSKWCAFPCP